MSQGQNQSPSDTQNKIEGGNLRKKINRDESSNPSGQFQDEGRGQGSNGKEASINNLPPEMLLEILQCVDTRSLFASRLVNRNFSSISSAVLCHRPDAQIQFQFINKNEFVWFKWQRVDVGLQAIKLQDFVGCVKKSKNFPYAHFAFSVPISTNPFAHFLFAVPVSSDPNKFFNHPDFTQFLSCFSASKSSSSQNQNQNQTQRIKGLDFKFSVTREMSLMKFLAAKLGNLIQNETPQLENLSLEFECEYPSLETFLVSFRSSQSNQTPAEINAQQIQLPVPLDFQLPHLKVLRFKGSTSNDLVVLEEFLSAAVNLKKIYLYEPRNRSYLPIAFENFDFLQSLGKFQLLKNFDFYINDQRLSKLRERPDFIRALFNLELEELVMGKNPKPFTFSDNTDVTSFISALFQSQKDSVKKLEMIHLGEFTALQFPTFKNMTHLKLEGTTFPSQTFFPRGVRSLDIFPAVRQLDLPENWCCGFPHFDSIPVLPSVKSLSVVGKEFGSNSIYVLDLLCPNLKHLKIHKDDSRSYSSSPQLNFLPVGRKIWRLMTQLESLEVDIRVDLIENTCARLDSCFTGISMENVQRLYHMQEAESESESESESGLTAEREHASILDMKSLTKLTVNPYENVSGVLTKMDKKEFYNKRLTWVSHEYAFILLPNLKLN